MNIYAFLNSEDIRAHCEKIGHTFNALESAYLIYQSQNHTIGEKHAAWRELIETMPDMPMEARMATPGCDSLHDFLRRYMALEDRLVERFFRQEEDCVYRFDRVQWEMWQGECKNQYVRGEELYRTFSKELFFEWLDAEKELVADFAEEAGSLCLYVTKTKLISKCRQKPWALTLRVNEEGVPLAIDDCERAQIQIHTCLFPRPDGELARFFSLQLAFDEMWIPVPTPFQKGDILFVNDQKLGLAPEPFVLTSLCTDQETERDKKIYARLLRRGDRSDMSAFGCWVTEDGRVDHSVWDYLNLEYYPGELKGRQRLLKVLQGYWRMRKEEERFGFGNYAAMYMEACHYILLDEQRRELEKRYEEEWAAMGLFLRTDRNRRAN